MTLRRSQSFAWSRRSASFIAACCLVTAIPTFAQRRVQPFDKVTTTRHGDVSCHTHAMYTIVAREHTDSVGSDLFIRDARLRRCDADSLPADFVWRNRFADYFLGIRGDVLFIDDGTAITRGLTVVDLRARRIVVSTDYIGSVMLGPNPTTVTIWRDFELKAPAKGCKRPPYGNLPGIDSLYWVDFKAGTLRFAGKTRCAVRE
jgi:hypothetical protein